MSYTEMNLEALTSLISLENVARNVIILPFSLVQLPNGECKYVILAKHTITDFLTQFGGQMPSDVKLPDFLRDQIFTGTRGLLDITDFNWSIFYASTIPGTDGVTYLNNNKPIIALVFLPSDSNDTVQELQSLNNLIVNFINKVKIAMRNDPFSEDFNENLVYLTETELFYLVRGTEYLVDSDDDTQTFSFSVSDGMLFKKDIITLYATKEGDIPIEKMQSGNEQVNHPFVSMIYSKINGYISSNILELFETFESPFLKHFSEDINIIQNNSA